MKHSSKRGRKYHLTDNGYELCDARVKKCPLENVYFLSDEDANTAYNSLMKTTQDPYKGLNKSEMVRDANLVLLNSERGKKLQEVFHKDPNDTFESLSEFANVASENLARLTDQQKKALYVYTEDGPDYRYLNKALRDNDVEFMEKETRNSVQQKNSPLYRSGQYTPPPAYRFKDLAADLDSLFTAETKLKTPQALFRGLTMKDSFMGDSNHEFYERLLTVGEEFSLKGYSSTAPDFHQASIFTTPNQELVLEMVTDKGVTWHRTEVEHLLPRDTTWVVASSRVVESYGQEYLTIQVVDKDLLKA